MNRTAFVTAIVLFAISSLFASPQAEDSELKTLRTAQVAADGPGLLDYFRKRTTKDADRNRLTALIRQLGDENYATRERATVLLGEYGLPAISMLRQALTDTDIEVVRRAERCLSVIEKVPTSEVSAAAARRLARLKPDGAAATLLAYLPFADDEIVAEEVREALVALAVRDGQPEPALLTALDDALPLRRSAAGVALIRAKVPVAQKLLTDPDLDVRLRVTLAAVLYAKDKAAVATLINLLAEAPVNQAWRAEEVLIRLANETGPNVALGRSDDSRKKARDAWSEWWSKSADNIDMAKLDAAPKMLGLTLVVQSNRNRVGGRIYEINPGGEILWKIENLQQPFDALVLAKNRVVIAEQNTNLVTWRDFQGTILHNRPVTMPCNLQALPNGHLLIASRNQVVELDQDRQEVFQLQRDRFDIAAAVRDRNGEYFVLTNMGNLIRFDRTRKELKSFNVGAIPNRSYYIASLDLLPSGRILVSHQNGYSEWDPNGTKIVGPIVVPGPISSVQRLSNGHTLLAGLTDGSVAEYNKEGKVVWDHKPADGFIAVKAHRR